MAKKVRTFMIAPALWSRFKKHARLTHSQTASARLREIIEQDIKNGQPRLHD